MFRDVMEDIDMSNGMDPDKMMATERLDELSALLAVAILRIRIQRRTQGDLGDLEKDSLELSAEMSPPVTAGP